MSTLKVNNLQVGQDGTAANNYTLYQPASPDGTVRLGYGVAGSVTDILTLKNSSLGIGTDNPTDKLSIVAAANSLVIGAKDSTRGNHIFQLLADDTRGNGELRLYRHSASGTHEKVVEITSSGNSYFKYGNIGIGTDSPVSLLHVHGSSNSLSIIRLSGTATSQVEYDIRQGILGVSNGGFSIRDITNSATRFAITSGGNVGIGIENPTEKLHLIGKVGGSNPSVGSRWDIARFVSSDYVPTNSGGLTIGAYWNNTDVNGRRAYIQSSQNLDSGSTARDLLLNPDGGNIGIGTDSPAALLHLESTAANAAKLRIGFDSPRYYDIFRGSTTNGGYLNFYGSQSTYVGYIFDGVDGEWMRIKSNGKVGIGEDDPIGQLDIKGNVSSTTQFSGFDGLRIHNANGAAFGVTADMYFTAGTTSSNRGAAIGSELVSGYGNDLYFATNGGNVSNTNVLTERLRITSGGNVGIGETQPTSRLVVQETNASGDVGIRVKNDTLTDGSASTPTTSSLYLNTSTGDFNTFYIQARRYDNDTHFGYADPRSNGHTPNMIISNDGIITRPNQPRFIAKLTANTTYNPSNFGNHVDFDSEEYDIGGNFTTSGTDQGLFTAPVAGLYHFNGAAYGAGVAWTQSWFTVNASRKSYTDWVVTGTGDFIQNSQAIYLNAGDKVGFHPHRSGVANYTVYANVHHTYFSGYLIG